MEHPHITQRQAAALLPAPLLCLSQRCVRWATRRTLRALDLPAAAWRRRPDPLHGSSLSQTLPNCGPWHAQIEARARQLEGRDLGQTPAVPAGRGEPAKYDSARQVRVARSPGAACSGFNELLFRRPRWCLLEVWKPLWNGETHRSIHSGVGLPRNPDMHGCRGRPRGCCQAPRRTTQTPTSPPPPARRRRRRCVPSRAFLCSATGVSCAAPPFVAADSADALLGVLPSRQAGVKPGRPMAADTALTLSLAEFPLASADPCLVCPACNGRS